MNEAIEIYLVKITLAVFVVLALFYVGIRLNLREAINGLRNVRFTALTLIWGYVLCPGLAYGLTKVIQLEQPYAIGMILVAVVPCGLLLPQMVNRARGVVSSAAASMLLTPLVTVIYVPFVVPVLAPSFAAGAATIGKPLLLLVLLPMAIGIATKSVSPHMTSIIEPFLGKAVTFIASFLFVLVASSGVYVRGFLSSIGGYAISTLILFFLVASAASYWLSPGLEKRQKSVLSLGMSTRSLATAFVPFLAVQNIDRRAMVMVVLAMPIQFLVSWFAARLFARRARTDTAEIDGPNNTGVWAARVRATAAKESGERHVNILS